MDENVQKYEDLEDKIVEHLAKDGHVAHLYELKGVIVKLAMIASDEKEQELLATLEKALEFCKNKTSFEGISENIIEDRKKNLNRTIKEFGIDSREAWLARLSWTSLHSMPEDDDTLLTLIFEYSTACEFDINELFTIFRDQIQDFSDYRRA